MLRDGSGINDDVIAARGYRTITDEAELAVLGLSLIHISEPTRPY